MVQTHFASLEYLRHNLPWDRLISRQTDKPWPSYSQDLNPPAREDIIKREIRWIPQEKLVRVVDNFNVRVAAVLSYRGAVHGTNIELITEKV